MKSGSIFYKKPYRVALTFAAWWTLIFWTLPFIYMWINGLEKLSSSNWLFMTCGIAAMITAILIYVAMWIYLFARSQAPRSSRVLWGIAFLLTGWYGSCLYFLTVYRRDFLAEACAPRQPVTPSQPM